MKGVSNSNKEKTDRELEEISHKMWKVLLESEVNSKDAIVILSRVLSEFYSQAVEKGWQLTKALDVFDEHTSIIRKYILSRGNVQ